MVVMTGAIVSVIVQIVWSLVKHKATVARKPIKYFKLGAWILMLGLFANYVIRDFFGQEGLPRGLTLTGTFMAIATMIFVAIAEEVIDRDEYEQVVKLEATHLAEKSE